MAKPGKTPMTFRRMASTAWSRRSETETTGHDAYYAIQGRHRFGLAHHNARQRPGLRQLWRFSYAGAHDIDSLHTARASEYGRDRGAAVGPCCARCAGAKAPVST